MSYVKEGYKQTKVGVIPEDWDVVKLKEIFEKSFYGISDSTSDNGKYPVLRMGNMQNGTLDLTELVYIDLDEKKFKKFKLQKGDILLNRTNSYDLVGKISIFNLNESFITASYIVTFRPNEKKINSIFINNLLNSKLFQYKIKNLATKGVSQANINPTSFKEIIQIPLPPLKEQQKIANILSTWDSAISKQEELITQKEKLKKGLMQKLLSGEVRFGGFDDEWEEVKLGEIGKTFNGLSGKSAKDFGMGEAKYITYKNIFYNPKISLLQLDQIKIEKNEKQNLVQYGDIFFTVSSETPEEVGMSSVLLDDIKNTYINSFCFGYRLNDFQSMEPNFARFYFRSFYIRDKIMRLAQGSTRFNLSKNEVMKLNIKLPSLKEQQKIAKILTLADKEIELLKTELEQLKTQKKGLMQKLLTGEIRVKI
jgi:type I restriction enzyme S subunit